MKNTIVFIALIFSTFANAQEFKLKPTGTVSELTVVIQNLYADIQIVGSTTGELLIKVQNYEGIPEKAAGLKPLSAMGPENTGIGLNVEQQGNSVNISGAHRSADDANYTISIPKNVKLRVDYKSFQAGDIRIEGMANEVEVNSQIGDLVFENVTGPIVVNTLSADISIVFSTLSQISPTSITSTSGDIDVTLPTSSKGTFKMSSTSGEIYTDLDFTMNEQDGLKRMGGGMSANAKLNGGGVDVTLRCISGDIFIRKAN